jgi:hypothetical protein
MDPVLGFRSIYAALTPTPFLTTTAFHATHHHGAATESACVSVLFTIRPTMSVFNRLQRRLASSLA